MHPEYALRKRVSSRSSEVVCFWYALMGFVGGGERRKGAAARVRDE
jgi:hypothetical protein